MRLVEPNELQIQRLEAWIDRLVTEGEKLCDLIDDVDRGVFAVVDAKRGSDDFRDWLRAA